MKIEKTITITDCFRSYDFEVSVDVDADDICAAIREDTKHGESAVLGSFSDFIRFWQAVPDEIYAGFNDHQRKIIGENLEKTLAKVKGESHETPTLPAL